MLNRACSERRHVIERFLARFRRGLRVKSSRRLRSVLKSDQVPEWACSSAGRASRLQREGQGFESPHVHQSFNQFSGGFTTVYTAFQGLKEITELASCTSVHGQCDVRRLRHRAGRRRNGQLCWALRRAALPSDASGQRRSCNEQERQRQQRHIPA